MYITTFLSFLSRLALDPFVFVSESMPIPFHFRFRAIHGSLMYLNSLGTRQYTLAKSCFSFPFSPRTVASIYQSQIGLKRKPLQHSRLVSSRV